MPLISRKISATLAFAQFLTAAGLCEAGKTSAPDVTITTTVSAGCRIAGQTCEIIASITNDSAKELAFRRESGAALYAQGLEMYIVDEAGRPLATKVPRATWGHTSTKFTRLQPGGVCREVFYPDKQFDLSKPGSYGVVIKLKLEPESGGGQFDSVTLPITLK